MRTDFEWQRKLGQGSFGEVHLVTRKADRRDYVIKSMHIQGLPRKQQEDALNEVRLLAGVDHPRVVRYHDSFCAEGKLHIVMEHCAGGDLAQLIDGRAGAPLPEESAWRYFVQTLLGLHHLHGLKILHRDLKTRNLFLSADGDVKIGDLGVARLLGASTDFASTMVGTPYYLSPELCENAPYNETADVWALGVVLYELLALAHPFEARNQAALVLKILRAEYVPPAGYSAGVLELLASCLRSMVKGPSLAGQSSPSQPPRMEAFGPRLLYTLWRSHGATLLALRG